MVLIESSDGSVLLTREQLRERVRRDLEDLSLVEDLLAERLDAEVLTADKAWGDSGRVAQIR